MSDWHLPAEFFALYFRGLLDELGARILEKHAASCETCAARLREEARVELALYEVVEASPRPRLRRSPSFTRRPHSRAFALAFVAAAAAVVALFVRVPHNASAPPVAASSPSDVSALHDTGAPRVAVPSLSRSSWARTSYGRSPSTPPSSAVFSTLLGSIDVAPAMAFTSLASGGADALCDLYAVDVPMASTYLRSASSHAVGLRAKWCAGSDRDQYSLSADSAVHHGSGASLSLASRSAWRWQSGSAMQVVPADDYRGSRVRLSAYVKAERVLGSSGLWMRVDGPTDGHGESTFAGDEMRNRPITGTADWRPYSVVLDVAPEARSIAFGVQLLGEGHVWADEIALEQVDVSVPSTDRVLTAASTRGVSPKWSLGWSPPGFTARADSSVRRAGSTSLVLESKGPTTEFGSAGKYLVADRYRGARVRLSAYVKAERVGGWAGLWMRVDGRGPLGPAILAFDNMSDRAVRGTSDWTQYSVVLDVGADAKRIALGALLSGEGRIWVDDVVFEVVDDSVALTAGVGTTISAAHVAGVAPAWEHWEKGASEYEVLADPGVRRTGPSSVSLASKHPTAEMFGVAGQRLHADRYRGSRLRFSAYVKATEVRGTAGLAMQIDGTEAGPKLLAFDKMANRPITGTSDWTQYSVVLDVPREADSIRLGVLLEGEGHVWMDDVVLEEVDRSVLPTAPTLGAQ